MLKKYKFIIVFLFAILLICITTQVNAAQFYKLKWESVVRDSRNNVITILPAGTHVKYLGASNINGHYRIEYHIFSNNSIKSKTGNIRKSVLTKAKNTYTLINREDARKNDIIKNKMEIVKLSYAMNRLEIRYNQYSRVNFYKNYRTAGATDCSSLCSTIYNIVLDLDMYRDTARTNVWTATDFIRNVNNKLYTVDDCKKIPKMFNIVKDIKNGNGKLSAKNLQIGDCIIIGKGNSSLYDHIAMYIGDGRIIEAIHTDGGNGIAYKKLIIRPIPSYYYIASPSTGPGKWSKICQIRPFSKYMAIAPEG